MSAVLLFEASFHLLDGLYPALVVGSKTEVSNEIANLVSNRAEYHLCDTFSLRGQCSHVRMEVCFVEVEWSCSVIYEDVSWIATVNILTQVHIMTVQQVDLPPESAVHLCSKNGHALQILFSMNAQAVG